MNELEKAKLLSTLIQEAEATGESVAVLAGAAPCRGVCGQ